MRGRAALPWIGAAVALVLSPAVGETAVRLAPDFAYEDINPASATFGQKLRLSEVYAERGVALNFLASWCGYCWKELPYLEQLHARGDVRIVAVAADEAPAPPEIVLSLVKKAGATIPVLWVPADESAEMERRYDHEMLPTTYVIDERGRIRRVLEGAVPVESLVRTVLTHLGPEGAVPPPPRRGAVAW